MTDEQQLTQAERRRRAASRLAYMEGTLRTLFEKDRDAFLATAADRILLAAQDVYGKDSPATSFLSSVKDTGKPSFGEFDETLIPDDVSLIRQDEAAYLGQNLAYELLCVHNRHFDYFEQENLSGLWQALEHAGMSHDDIGAYFERFDKNDI